MLNTNYATLEVLFGVKCLWNTFFQEFKCFPTRMSISYSGSSYEVVEGLKRYHWFDAKSLEFAESYSKGCISLMKFDSDLHSLSDVKILLYCNSSMSMYTIISILPEVAKSTEVILITNPKASWAF